MVFSIQWAGVSAAYVGMIFGSGMMWRAHAAEPFGSMKIFTVLVGLLFGGAASLPFVVSNFAAALLSAWLAQGQRFEVRFATFAGFALVLGLLNIAVLRRAFRSMAGSQTDLRTYGAMLGLAIATFLLAWLLMRYAPTARPGAAA